jgi:hypothetical protein
MNASSDRKAKGNTLGVFIFLPNFLKNACRVFWGRSHHPAVR